MAQQGFKTAGAEKALTSLGFTKEAIGGLLGGLGRHAAGRFATGVGREALKQTAVQGGIMGGVGAGIGALTAEEGHRGEGALKGGLSGALAGGAFGAISGSAGSAVRQGRTALMEKLLPRTGAGANAAVRKLAPGTKAFPKAQSMTQPLQTAPVQPAQRRLVTRMSGRNAPARVRPAAQAGLPVQPAAPNLARVPGQPAHPSLGNASPRVVKELGYDPTSNVPSFRSEQGRMDKLLGRQNVSTPGASRMSRLFGESGGGHPGHFSDAEAMVNQPISRSFRQAFDPKISPELRRAARYDLLGTAGQIGAEGVLPLAVLPASLGGGNPFSSPEAPPAQKLGEDATIPLAPPAMPWRTVGSAAGGLLGSLGTAIPLILMRRGMAPGAAPPWYLSDIGMRVMPALAGTTGAIGGGYIGNRMDPTVFMSPIDAGK